MRPYQSLPQFSSFPWVAIDTETTGLHWWKDRLFGVSVAYPAQDMQGERAFYYDIREQGPQFIYWLTEQIGASPRTRLIAHNAKFDAHMLREIGVTVPKRRLICTVVMSAILNEHEHSLSLDYLGKKYLQRGKTEDIWDKLHAMFGGKPGKSGQIKNLSRAPSSLVAEYAIPDAELCGDLYALRYPKIEEDEGLRATFDVEMKLLDTFIAMEHRGVRVDVDATSRAVEEIDKRARLAQKRLDALAGDDFNANSPVQVRALVGAAKTKAPPTDPKHRLEWGPEGGAVSETDKFIWTASDGTFLETTTAGNPSIDSKALRRMTHPAAKLILEVRKFTKMRDTFLKGHILGHHHKGRIHANFNQTRNELDDGTITGRISITDPALQQIHKRDEEMAAIIRPLFLPDESELWVCNDWSQMDFRMFAHYINDPKINGMYAEDPDSDFHSIVSELVGVPRNPRFAGDANAKQINLGMVFGMGAGKLAREMGMAYERVHRRGREFLIAGPEAQAVVDKYHDSIPGVKGMLMRAEAVAKKRGHVRTVLGRHLRYPHGTHAHKAAGHLFQGSAADALKLKLVELDEYFDQTGYGQLLLNVHDEFDSSVNREHIDKATKDITEIVTTFGDLFRVPIRSDQGVGENWWEASK